jgi:hypothetical protein
MEQGATMVDSYGEQHTRGRGDLGEESLDQRDPRREAMVDRWAIPAPRTHMGAVHRGRETGSCRLCT